MQRKAGHVDRQSLNEVGEDGMEKAVNARRGGVCLHKQTLLLVVVRMPEKEGLMGQIGPLQKRAFRKVLVDSDQQARTMVGTVT